MEITFIRHAEKEELGEDPFLTKKGIKQAKYLARKLKKEQFDEFYSSDLNRSKQTADIVSRKIKLNPKIEKSLNEFKSEMIKKDEKEWTREEKKHYSQMISFLKKMTKNPDEDKSILIIAHGITNRIILSYFFGLEIKKLVPFIQSESGLNSIYWVKKFKNWRLKTWNDNHHIPRRLRPNKFN